MALNLLNDDELELLDSKGVEALSDDALERLDAEDAPAPSIPSPIAATADGLQRLNQGITDAAVAAAKPVAAPIDAAIKRVDERSALAMPHIPTTQKTAEGDVHGDLFPDLITAAAGKVTGQLVDKALGDTPELVKRGVKDVTAGAVQLGSGVGGVMRAMGFENIGQMIAKSAQQTAKELMPPDPNIVDQIAQGLGSMAAFMVPGLGISGSASAVATVAPRLAMFLGTATSTVLEAGTEAGDVYNKVMEKTGDKNEANVAAGRAFFANLPLIHYTNKLGWAGEQSGRLARALESFFTEGFQEGGQEFISNLAAHDPLMKGVVEAAFVGGIVGAGAGAVAHGPVTAIQHPEGQPPAPPAPPAAPAAPAAAAPEMVGPGTGKPVHLVTEAEREGGAPAPAAPAPAPIPTPEEIKAKPEPVKPEAPKKKGKKGKKAKAEVVESDAEDGVEPGAEPQEGPEETVDPEDPLAKLKAEAMAENKALAEKERPIGSEITWKEAKGKKGKGTVVGHSWRADGFTLKVRVGGTEKTLENGKKIVEGGKFIYLGAEEDIGVKMGEKAKLYKEAETKQENDRQAAYEAKRDADEKVVAEKLTVLKELHAKAMAAPKAERAAIAEEYAKKLEDYEAAIEGAGYNWRSDVRAREKVGFIEPPPTALLYRETSSEEMDKSPEFKAAVKEAVESSSTRSEFREKLAEIVLNKDIPVNRTLLGVLADTKAGEALGIEGRDIHGMDTLGGSPFSGQKQADEMSRIAAPMLEKMKAVKPSKEKAELLKKFAAKLDSILPDTPRKGKKAKGSDDITAATRAQLVEAARMGEISDDVIRSITESGKVTSDGSTGLRGHIQLSTKEMDIDIHEGFFDKEIKVAKSNTELMAKAAALDLKQKGLPPSVNEESRARLVQWVRESTVGWRGSDEYIDDVRFVIDNFTAPAEALVKAMRGWKDSGRHPADQIVLMRGEGIIKELGWPTREGALYHRNMNGELETFGYLMRKEPDYAGHREVTPEERTRDLVDYYDPVTDGGEIVKAAREEIADAKKLAKEAKGKNAIAAAEANVREAEKSLKEIEEKLAKPGAITPDAPKIEYAEEDIPAEAPVSSPDDIIAQLEKAGYDSKTAKNLAVVYEGFRVLGDRAGIAAHKLFDAYAIKMVKGKGGFTIEGLKGADIPSFMNSMAHLYLDALAGIAADPAASEQVKKDHASITTYLGPVDGIITPAHEEHFAAAARAYLMTGEVSGQNLREAFDGFKPWVEAVYEQLDALDADLTPEVRRVFDRLLTSDAKLAVELQAAEKALGRARKRKNEADSQAPPEAPQDAAPAANAAVVEETARVEKAKAKAKPVAKQALEKPGDGARILGVKRSIVQSLSEIGALIDSNEPMTQLKPTQLERLSKAGLLDAEFKLTPLAREAAAELKRVRGLMETGYLEDISVSEPKKITLKSFLKSIVHDSRFGLLKTFDLGWFCDGRIMFRTMKEDAPVFAPFKHMGEKFQAPMLDPVIESAAKATDLVVGVLGVHEIGEGKQPSYLLGTEGQRQIVVAADYYNFFKDRYPDAKFYAQGAGLPLKVEQGGQLVGALMPMKTDGPYTVYSYEGVAKVVEMSKGRLEVDAKVVEINQARAKHDFAKKVHAENAKEIRQLDETPGEKTAALITKIAEIQKENIDLEDQMAEAVKAIASLEEQVAALREQHGIQDIPASGLVKKSRPKGGKGGGKGASSGDFAYDTPVEMGGMEHIKPFRMPEMVRLAYELMGQVPEVGGLRKYNGYFKGVGGGEIKLNPLIFLKPEQAAKTLAHEIGHLIDYLPDHTLKRGNLLGSLKSLHAHLANTFGTLQVTNKDLRDELMAVTDYWRPWDKEASTDSYRAYRKSARELYADAISMLFNSPGTLERMAPKFYKGFFEALDAKPAVKLAFFQLQALLNSSEMNIQEARHLDRKAMYLKAEDLWALKRKEQEARESHYAEWFKQLVVEKHQKAIGMAEAEASKGQPLPPSQDPRYILEELSLADNANHAFLEEIDAKVVKPMTDSEVTLLDLGDYLYLSRVAQGDRQAFANPKGYNPDEAGKAIDYMRTRLGAERFGKLEAAAAAFREVVYKLSEEAVAVGAYSQQVFDEKIKPNRGSYAVFAVQDFLEDYIAAGVKEQIGTLKDIANPFTATVMKMVALNRLIAKQKGANVMRDFLLQRGEAEKAEALNPQDNLVQFRQRKGRGLLELLENGKRAAYYVDPYIAEAFKKKEAGTFHLAVKILDSVFNGVFRPLYITFNIGFQLYSNPIRDFGRTRRNVYALVKNEGYAGTVKSLMMAYFDSLSPAAKRAMDIPDALVSEMIANKSLDITFTDFSFDPDADQYTAVLRKMGVAPPQQNGLMDKLSKTKVLYPLVRLLEGIRFIGNAHETASKIAGYKVLKSDMLKTLDAAIRDEKDAGAKARYQSERQKLEKGEGEFAHQLAYNTRNYVGTPNWRRRGTISHITNTLFPFSNIMVQGMRSDLEVATRPETRTGFMLDMVLTQVLPKLLMFMAALGGAGDDLEEFFRKVSEYDKSNYLVVPMGWSYDEKGGRKAVYWRVPHDESGRLIAAVSWKMMNAMRGDPKALQQIVDFGAGQLPKLAPPITIGANWVAYLSGKNPYDDFRGRPIMPDKVYQAGGRYALTSMVKWTANQMGLASFATHDPSSKSGVESMLEVAPLLNRVIKVSDYGEHEESMKTLTAKQAEDAALSLDRGQAAVSYTKERYILSQKLAADEISTDERTRLSRLNKYYPIYLTYTKAIKRANDKGDQEKVEHYRERLDGILAKVVE